MESRPLESVEQTAAQMVRMVRQYATDLGEKASWPLPKFFRFVADLEYRADPKGHESLSRPALAMGESWPWRDCDDKAIMIGSWCWINKIPFKFVASSKRPDKTLHHTWVMAEMFGKQLPLDATYPKNYVGYSDPKNTFVTPLTGDLMQSTLNTFEGDQVSSTLLGSSFLSRMKRRAKKAAPWAAAAALGPAGIVALAAYKKKKHGRVLSGEELLGSSFMSRMKRRTKNAARKAAPWAAAAALGPAGIVALAAYKKKKHGRVFAGDELLGSSFASRMMRRTKNVARQTGNLARQAAPVLDIVAPGLSSRIQSITGKIKGKGAAAQAQEEIKLAPTSAAEPIWKKKWFIPAVGGAAVLLFVMSRKNSAPASA